MDDYKRMAVFAAVVRHRSMSAAARALGLTTSAVSQQVRQLERDGGVTLLHRSTRRLAPTAAGERFHARCEAMVAAAEAARRELDHARDAPEGELRLAAPVGFARHVAPALGGLLAAHAGLTLQLQVDDAMIDLVAARIDLAIRFGQLDDSSWAARPLGRFEQLVCAAPAYLERHGTPQSPADLFGHQWLALRRESGPPQPLELHGGDGAVETLRLEPRLASNNQLSLQQMAVAGLGCGRFARLDVHDDLQAGRLVPLLPGWRPPPLPVWAVTPQRDAQPAKVRHAIAALEAWLDRAPGGPRSVV